MDDETAILGAIAAQPDEDTPRLAYADWLDDHAANLPDPPAARVRAAFIRLQCEIKKYEHLPSTEQQGYADLYRQQDAILTRHRRDLLGPLGDDLTVSEAVFDRGFVTELRLDADRFLRHAETIAALVPLPDVSVFGAVPSRELCDSPRLGIVVAIQWESALVEADMVNPFVRPRKGRWSRLRQLTMAGCGIEDFALRAITVSPAYPVLAHLDLSINEITDIGVEFLVQSPLWPQLRSLVLGANPISDDGAFALADAPPTGLEHLSLGRTNIGPPGQRRLLRRKGWKVDLF